MSVGMGEIVMLVILALLIFGPQRLPEVARNVGEMVGKFKREASSAVDELKRAAEVEEMQRVSQDLRGTGQELSRALSLTAADAGPAPTYTTPAPFDPDAT